MDLGQTSRFPRPPGRLRTSLSVPETHQATPDCTSLAFFLDLSGVLCLIGQTLLPRFPPTGKSIHFTNLSRWVRIFCWGFDWCHVESRNHYATCGVVRFSASQHRVVRLSREGHGHHSSHLFPATVLFFCCYHKWYLFRSYTTSLIFPSSGNGNTINGQNQLY